MAEEPAGTRAALLHAASQLLEREGMSAVTLRAVGGLAGVSRTAPYRHFADKEALLSAVAAQDLHRLRAAMTGAADRAEGPRARLEAMTAAYVQFALAQPAHYRLMFGSALPKREHVEVQEAGKAALEVLVAAVAEAQQAGELPAGDPAALAALLWSAGHGAVDLAINGYAEADKGFGDPADMTTLLLDLLRGRSAAGRPGG